MNKQSRNAILFSFILITALISNLSAFDKGQGHLFSNDFDKQAAGEKLIFRGEFHKAEKRGSGTASVYQKENGQRILRFTNFSTSNGPDLFVYIYETKDAKNSRSLRNVKYVSLGRLKSHKGNQEYLIPKGLDLNSFRAVSVWCKEFAVNFTTASISAI